LLEPNPKKEKKTDLKTKSVKMYL